MIDSGLVCAAVLLAFGAARWLAARLGNPPWASPVLVAALVVGTGLAGLGVSEARFAVAAAPLRWLLGPALVALALVIDGNRGLLRARALPILVAVTGGTLVGVVSAIVGARLLVLEEVLVRGVATKTVSTPFAVAIQSSVDGPVALAAALAVLTGVIGALLVPAMFEALRVRDATARALGLGVSSHIVGTDWLTRRDARAGGMAALAMVLAGTLVAVLLPLLWRLVG